MRVSILFSLIGLLSGVVNLSFAPFAHAQKSRSAREDWKYFSIGFQLFESSNYEEAEKYMAKSWKSNPKNGRTAYYLGRIHNELENYEEATRWFSSWETLGLPQRPQIENIMWDKPRFFSMKTPQYLSEVHGEKLQEEFTVGVLIGKDGKSKKAEPLYGNDILKKVAVNAAKRFRLTPKEYLKEVGDAWIVVEVKFSVSGLEVVDIQQQAVDKMPEVIKPVEPEYPKAARDADITGYVVYRLQIGTDGKVKQVEIIDGPEELHEAVKKAALQQEFTPALHKDQPVTLWVKKADYFGLE